MNIHYLNATHKELYDELTRLEKNLEKIYRDYLLNSKNYSIEKLIEINDTLCAYFFRLSELTGIAKERYIKASNERKLNYEITKLENINSGESATKSSSIATIDIKDYIDDEGNWEALYSRSNFLLHALDKQIENIRQKISILKIERSKSDKTSI